MFVLDLNICVKICTSITEKQLGENMFIKNMMIMQILDQILAYATVK